MALPATTTGVSLHLLTHPVTSTVSALTIAGDARQPQLSRLLDSLRSASAQVILDAEARPDPH